jgi:hypothetical protein
VFLFAVLVLGIGFGFVFGGRFRGLLLERFRMTWLLVLWLVAAGAPVALVASGFEGWPTGAPLVALRTAYSGLCYLLPLGYLAWNLFSPRDASHDGAPHLRALDRAGVALILAGTLAMAVVVIANGGAMPVSALILASSDNPAMQYGLSTGLYLDRSVIGPGTVLPWLARTMPLPLLPADPPFLSLGEIVAGSGLLLLVLSLMRPFDRWRGRERPITPPRRRSRRPARGLRKT